MPWGQPRAAPLEEAPAGGPLRRKPEATSGLRVANLSAAEPPKVRLRPKREVRAGKAHPRAQLGCTPGWGPPAGLGRECGEEPGDSYEGGSKDRAALGSGCSRGGAPAGWHPPPGSPQPPVWEGTPGPGQPLFKFWFCGTLGKDPTFQSFSSSL